MLLGSRIFLYDKIADGAPLLIDFDYSSLDEILRDDAFAIDLTKLPPVKLIDLKHCLC